MRDLHSVAKAESSAGKTLLETPSGKIKQDTIFERFFGLGKKSLQKFRENHMKKDRFPSKKQNRKYKKDLIINCLFLEEENHLPSEENMKKAYDIAKQFSSSGASILFQTELQKNIFNDGIAKGMIEHMKNEPSI